MPEAYVVSARRAAAPDAAVLNALVVENRADPAKLTANAAIIERL